MAKDKAPGPDGFTTNFFHACWDWLKEEIWALVEDSRKSGSILRALNSTFLTLIPKESGTEDPRKLRPIALCNVIYKIIFKVIANRLRPSFLSSSHRNKLGSWKEGKLWTKLFWAMKLSIG